MSTSEQRAEHTPGPWRRGIGNEAHMVFDAQGRIVAERCGYADGNLIAASPDLAEACRNAWKALSWIIAYDSEDKVLKRAIDKIEAAVNKSRTYDYAAMRRRVEASRPAPTTGQRNGDLT